MSEYHNCNCIWSLNNGQCKKTRTISWNECEIAHLLSFNFSSWSKRLLSLAAVQRTVEMRGGDCKKLLYATFVKTVTATRLLERMFPIHALYRLITGPATQAALYIYNCTIESTIYNIHFTIQFTIQPMTNTLIFQKFRGPSTSKWLLAVFNILATSRQKDKTTYLVVRL